MRKLTERFKWLQLLLGFILIGLGVVTIILAAKGENNFETTIFVIWAIFLFVIAGTFILLDLLAFMLDVEFTGLLIAGICIGFGVFVIANQDFLTNVISTLLPYVLISISGVLLLKTIILAIKRVDFKKWLLVFIISVIFLASGIVFICVKDMLKVIYIALGILFVVLGGVELVGLITRLSQARHERKQNAVAERKNKRAKKAPKNTGDNGVAVVQELDAQPVQEQEEVEALPAGDEEQPSQEPESDDDVQLIE